MILFQTNPFWISILAYFINRERILRIELVAMALCFGGVMMIAYSKTDSGPGTSTNLQEGKPSEMFGIMVAFSVAWFFAGCNVINRKLSEVHFSVIMLYHSLLGTFMALVFIAGDWLVTGNFLILHDWNTYGYLFVCCFLDFFSINATNIAFQSDSSGFVSIIGYIVVFYGFLADEFIFETPITGLDLAGAVCIFVVTVAVTIYKLRQSNTPKKLQRLNESKADSEVK